MASPAKRQKTTPTPGDAPESDPRPSTDGPRNNVSRDRTVPESASGGAGVEHGEKEDRGTASGTPRRETRSTRREAVRSSPRATPREDARSEAPASRPAASQPAKATADEPDLPPTPRQRGLDDPEALTPPSGIHDTPSRRRRRRDGRTVKSSPLKPNAATAPEPAQPTLQARLEAVDPLAGKRSLKNQLEGELQQLKADITLAEQEHERIRAWQQSGQTGVAEPPNEEDIISLLLRAVPKKEHPPPPPKRSIFQNMAAFLPFAALPTRSHVDSVRRSDAQPPSHLPVALDDPLPYLQLFTPLTFSSTTAVLPPAQSTAAPVQFHSITARSSPPGLFSAQVDISVSSETFTVLSLAIPKIDAAADAELGWWMRERASRRAVLGRDVCNVFWAMSRWTETAQRRAAFWCAIDHEFGTRHRLQRSVARLEEKVRLGGRKRRSQAAPLGDDEDAMALVPDDLKSTSTWKKHELLVHMGRTSMTVTLPDDVELLLSWRIEFDWTGEAESRLEARARLPQAWHELDDRKSLRRIPDLFDRLVTEHGALEAVRSVVLLLNGTHL